MQRDGHPLASFLGWEIPSVLLAAISFVYGVACKIRVWSFRAGILRSRRLDCKVLSVGNLTTGGTGKTPIVIALAEYLSRKGISCAVLSRGYMGRRAEDIKWVSDGRAILTGPREAGDEPYLMAMRLTGVPIVVGADRFRAGTQLLRRHRVDIALLDDAYQHLYLHRDINLLLIDGTLPFGPGPFQGRLLPRGTLREPLSHIGRASAILVTRMEQTSSWNDIERMLRGLSPAVPIFRVYFNPTVLIHLESGEEAAPSLLKDQIVVTASGIGRPESFRFFLERLGAKVRGNLEWRDHHEYSRADVADMISVARERGAGYVVTTEKDGVKLKKFLKPSDPVWTLRVEVDRIEDAEAWERFISERIGIH